MNHAGHNFKILFIFTYLLTINCVATAKLIVWKDNIPSSLSPFQNNPDALAQLTQDKIMVFAHPTTKTFLPTLTKNPNPLVRFTTAAVIVPVSSNTVEKTIRDYGQYPRIYPTLKSAKILEQDGAISQVRYKVSIPTPIPILNFNETIVFQHQMEQNSLASIVVDAPIPFGLGKIEWFALDHNKTLVTLTQWGDLDQPKGLLIRKIMQAIPEAKLGIPSGTNVFIMEALAQHFKATYKLHTLGPDMLAEHTLSKTQINQIAQLSKNAQHPVSFVHSPQRVTFAHGAENMRFVTTYQYYSQSPQQLQKWTQPQHYAALFPRQVKSVKITPGENQSQNADFNVRMGLGVINIPFRFKLNFSFPTATSNIFYANGGDLKLIKGQTQFNPHAQGTLLKMTTTLKIDESAPFLIRAARSLPYHDLLPTVGGNVVFAQKIKNVS